MERSALSKKTYTPKALSTRQTIFEPLYGIFVEGDLQI
jgi:hypothetical protein